MTVYVFIIESANTETFDVIFEGKEIYDLSNPVLKLKMNFSAMEEAIASVAARFKDRVSVILVDRQYQITYYHSEAGKNEHEVIKNMKSNNSEIKFCNSNWDSYIQIFNGLDDSCNYVFLTAENFINIYDMANNLELPINQNCYYAWGATNVLEVNRARSYYNIFSNIPRIKQIDSLGENVTEDEESIRWIVEYGVTQVKGLIKAGTLNKEKFIQSYVDHWILNPHSYFSKGIIIEFDLKPGPRPEEETRILKGLTITEQFNEDALYRYNLTDRMCRCLCKYGLEFGKIKSINNNPHTVNFDFLLT